MNLRSRHGTQVVRLSTPSRMRPDPFDVLWPMTSNLSRLVIGTKPNPNRLIRSPELLDLSRRSPSATFPKSSDMARRSKSIAPYLVVFPCSLAFDRAIPQVGSFKTEGVTAKTSYGTLSAAFPTQVPPRPDSPMTQVFPQSDHLGHRNHP